jgi:hypothetical protein
MLSAIYVVSFMLSDTNKPFILSVVMLIVIMLSFVMLNVIMLSVVMVNVVAPSHFIAFYLYL